jgi:hypothetical protein
MSIDVHRFEIDPEIGELYFSAKDGKVWWYASGLRKKHPKNSVWSGKFMKENQEEFKQFTPTPGILFFKLFIWEVKSKEQRTRFQRCTFISTEGPMEFIYQFENIDGTKIYRGMHFITPIRRLGLIIEPHIHKIEDFLEQHGSNILNGISFNESDDDLEEVDYETECPKIPNIKEHDEYIILKEKIGRFEKEIE